MTESVHDEHRRLLERMRELQEEHDRLEGQIHDHAGHEEHRRHLREQIAALKEHAARLRRELS